MPQFLSLSSVAARTPDGRVLFHDLTLLVGVERIGLVGRNGSGKSTLLRIMAGDLPPWQGEISRHGSVGLLAQEAPPQWSVADALGVSEACEAMARIVAGHGAPADFALADWELEARIDRALARVRLHGLSLQRRMGELSGGERARVSIARLYVEAPDLILLDEPTNNLDAAGREAVMSLIADWRGGVVIASHDRTLLQGVDSIAELAHDAVRRFGGGWDAFAAARDMARERAAKQVEQAETACRAAQREAQARREALDKRASAGRAWAANSSEPRHVLTAMARQAEVTRAKDTAFRQQKIGLAQEALAEARAQVAIITPLTIALPPTHMPSKALALSIQDVTAQRGHRRFGPWSLLEHGPERIAVTGPNGAGKTTLLRLVAGLDAPSSGEIWRREGPIAFLDQHMALLDPERSILANLRARHPGLRDEAAHAICARFAFRNRDAQRLVGTLSGGERLRAGLAVAFSGPQPPWLLILDEPTNHLDIESCEILEDALRQFDGALLAASHDAAFLARIGIERAFSVEGPA